MRPVPSGWLVALTSDMIHVVLRGKGPSDVLVKELTDLVLPQLLVRERQCISSEVCFQVLL